MQRMNQCDWDELHEQWSNAVLDQELNPPKEPKATGKNIKYQYLKKTTPKAKFYCINQNDYGFWVPRSAIIQDVNGHVEVANWCKLKYITFI